MNDFASDRLRSIMLEMKSLRDAIKLNVFGSGLQKTVNPNPYTARDADSDRLVLEGIRRINFGRGIPDPTPFGESENVSPGTRISAPPERPENRLNRAARRYSKNPKGRVPRTTGGLFRYLDSYGGVSGMMSSEARKYDRLSAYTKIPKEEIESGVNSVVKKVDTAMGERPRTIGQILKNFKKLEMLINGMNEDGSPIPGGQNRNFSVLPLFFMAQTQPQLREALGDRFDGADTIPTLYDVGVYYAFASEVLDNPESFRDVNFILSPNNMPDIKTGRNFSGFLSILPVYYSRMVKRPKDLSREFPVSQYDRFGFSRGGQVVSDAGVVNYANIAESIILNTDTTNGQISILMGLEMIALPEDKSPLFRGSLVTADRTGVGLAPWEERQKLEFTSEKPLSETENWRKRIKDLLTYFDYYGKTWDELPKAMKLETTSIASVVSMINAANELFEKADEALRSDPNVSPQSVEAMKTEAKRLLEVSEIASGMLLTFHEFGHFFDGVGNYKNSPGYSQASDTGGRGLNAAYEYRRDMEIMRSLARGEISPYTEDVAEELMRILMKSIIKPFLNDYMVLANAEAVMKKLSDDEIRFASLEEKIRNFVNPNDMASYAWMKSVVAGQITNAADAASLLVTSGFLKIRPEYPPQKVESESRAVIEELRKIFSYMGQLARDPLVADANLNWTATMDNLNFDSLIASANPEQRAMFLAAKADALVSYAIEKVRQGKKQVSQLIEDIPVAFSYSGDEEQISSGLIKRLRESAFLSAWLRVQSFDISDQMTDWEKLMSGLISANPNAVTDFMDFYGRQTAKDEWFDSEAKFDKALFVKSEINKKFLNKIKGFNPAMAAINNAVNKRGYSGWKELNDEEAKLAAEAAPRVTNYADQRDYDLSSPIPKFIQTSNAETYAEMRAIMAMNLMSFLDKLTQDEKDALIKLHDQMMSRVNRMNEAMLRNSRRSTNRSGER